MSPGLPALLRCPLPPEAARHTSLLALCRTSAGKAVALRLLSSEVCRQSAIPGEMNAAVDMSLQLRMLRLTQVHIFFASKR